MNTTNPLGGIHAALDRYEADGRPPAAELPPTRGAEAERAAITHADECKRLLVQSATSQSPWPRCATSATT